MTLLRLRHPRSRGGGAGNHRVPATPKRFKKFGSASGRRHLTRRSTLMIHRITSVPASRHTQRGPDLASRPGSQGGRRYRPSGSPHTPAPMARGADSGASEAPSAANVSDPTAAFHRQKRQRIRPIVPRWLTRAHEPPPTFSSSHDERAAGPAFFAVLAVMIASWALTCGAWRADRVIAGVTPLDPRTFAAAHARHAGNRRRLRESEPRGSLHRARPGSRVALVDAGRAVAEALRGATIPVAQPRYRLPHEPPAGEHRGTRRPAADRLARRPRGRRCAWWAPRVRVLWQST